MRLLTRGLIFTTIMFFSISTVSAQLAGISMSQDTVYLQITGPDSDDNDDSTCGLELILTNDTAQSIPLKWKKTVITNSQPTWEFHVCDENTCYTSAVNSAEVVLTDSLSGGWPIAGWTSFVLGFSDYPATIYEGYAEVEFLISKVDDPNDFATVLFIFDSQSMTSYSEVEELSDLSVFPNPSNGIINLTGEKSLSIRELKVYDMVGIEKRTIPYDNEGQFDISALESGVYNILMMDHKNRVLARETVIRF